MSLEEQITIKGEYPLKGVITVPAEQSETYPAILILSGSGPTDRDGNVPKKRLFINMYNQLADELTEAGFLTLRYDKRGAGQSGGDFYTTGMWDLVDDAGHALAFLKQNPKVDKERIILLGHSEGCIIATALNEREPVNGIILSSGAAENIEEALKFQRESAYRELLKKTGLLGWLVRTFKLIDRSEKKAQKIFDQMISSNQDMIRIQLVAKMNAKWFREHFAYDVMKGMSHIRCPVLAITGDKDIQVYPQNVAKVPDLIRGEAEAHVIQDMNHVLREQKKEISILKAVKEYKKQANDPLHPVFIETVKNWVVRNFQKES